MTKTLAPLLNAFDILPPTKNFLTIFEKVLKERAGYDIIIINIYASVYKSRISAEMHKFTRTF